MGPNAVILVGVSEGLASFALDAATEEHLRAVLQGVITREVRLSLADGESVAKVIETHAVSLAVMVAGGRLRELGSAFLAVSFRDRGVARELGRFELPKPSPSKEPPPSPPVQPKRRARPMAASHNALNEKNRGDF